MHSLCHALPPTPALCPSLPLALSEPYSVTQLLLLPHATVFSCPLGQIRTHSLARGRGRGREGGGIVAGDPVAAVKYSPRTSIESLAFVFRGRAGLRVLQDLWECRRVSENCVSEFRSVG
uniref:Uncharacterized protein n=1 Tax=Physcomitrium patens TaxID=3218 RepID=A0A7I4D1K6_PHYPA